MDGRSSSEGAASEASSPRGERRRSEAAALFFPGGKSLVFPLSPCILCEDAEREIFSLIDIYSRASLAARARSLFPVCRREMPAHLSPGESGLRWSGESFLFLNRSRLRKIRAGRIIHALQSSRPCAPRSRRRDLGFSACGGGSPGSLIRSYSLRRGLPAMF